MGSYRGGITSELQRLTGLTNEQVVGDCPQSGFALPYRPSYLHLNLSNLCNLRCRMCFAGNSSEIEADPVHGQWAPAPHMRPHTKDEVTSKRNFFHNNREAVIDLLGDLSGLRRSISQGVNHS